MDYSKLSDAEINLAVAAIQFPQSERNTPYYHRPDTYIYHRNGTHEAKDYCNNPADAWPIIESRFISLQFLQGNWMASVNPSQETGFRAACFIERGNPLRAAMIVFLIMQESE